MSQEKIIPTFVTIGVCKKYLCRWIAGDLCHNKVGNYISSLALPYITCPIPDASILEQFLCLGTTALPLLQNMRKIEIFNNERLKYNSLCLLWECNFNYLFQFLFFFFAPRSTVGLQKSNCDFVVNIRVAFFMLWKMILCYRYKKM